MNCIFCKIINKEIPADFVYENDEVVAFLDIKPINKGHVLIVPKEHHEDMMSTPEAVLSDMILATKKVSSAIVKAVKADGFNIGINTKPAAGQVVFHTHFHVIPRFKDDGLVHWPHKELPKEEMAKITDAIKKQIK